MASTFRDRDNGYKATMKALDAAGKLEITVGIHGAEGDAPEGDGGRTVAEVAEAAEFGIDQPARPFVSAWADENGAAFVTRMRKESEAAVKARQSPATRLDALAQVAAGEIQARFPVPPPNAQATIDRKGFDSPLIDKGQLRSSILGKVGKK